MESLLDTMNEREGPRHAPICFLEELMYDFKREQVPSFKKTNKETLTKKKTEWSKTTIRPEENQVDRSPKKATHAYPPQKKKT